MSASFTNPLLFVNFGSDLVSVDLGSLPFTILSSFEAVQNGSVVTFPNAVGNGTFGPQNAGFAAQITGTFGPGSPLEFEVLGEAGILGFTVGLSGVPEPSVLFLTALGVAAISCAYRRRSNTAPNHKP